MKCILFCEFIMLIIVTGEPLKCYHWVGIDELFDVRATHEIMECRKESDKCFTLFAPLSNRQNLDIRSCRDTSITFKSLLKMITKRLPANVHILDNYTVLQCLSNYCNRVVCPFCHPPNIDK